MHYRQIPARMSFSSSEAPLPLAIMGAARSLASINFGVPSSWLERMTLPKARNFAKLFVCVHSENQKFMTVTCLVLSLLAYFTSS